MKTEQIPPTLEDSEDTALIPGNIVDTTTHSAVHTKNDTTAIRVGLLTEARNHLSKGAFTVEAQSAD